MRSHVMDDGGARTRQRRVIALPDDLRDADDLATQLREEDGSFPSMVLDELWTEDVPHHLLALARRFRGVERRNAPYIVFMGGLDDDDVQVRLHPDQFLVTANGHVRVKVPAPVSSRFSTITLEAMPPAPMVKVIALATPPFSPGGV